VADSVTTAPIAAHSEGGAGRRAAALSAAPGRGRTPRPRPARLAPAPGRCAARPRTARAHAGRAVGRHQRDRSSGGRYVPLHPLIPQIQFFRWAGEKEELMVGQDRHVEFKGERRTAASRLQADLPQPVARRGRLVGEEPEPVQGPDRLTPPWPFLFDDCPLNMSGRFKGFDHDGRVIAPHRPPCRRNGTCRRASAATTPR
jgi:hypothetical protein